MTPDFSLTWPASVRCTGWLGRICNDLRRLKNKCRNLYLVVDTTAYVMQSLRMTTTTNEVKYKVLGVNDDSDSCECCGKTGLKRVVWIESIETGLVQHFGVVCAANPSKAFGLKREIAKAVRADDKAREESDRAARYAEQMRQCEIKNAKKSELYALRGGMMKNVTISNGRVLTIPADSALMEVCHKEAWA